MSPEQALSKTMPTLPQSEQPPPKSWNEFEDICADLFALIWSDPNTVRYAVLGERQNGVDIRGALPDGRIVGVQCKRKRRWPIARLTKADIDVEVAEALKFTPPLSQFTIATTALNAAKLQAHVDAITVRHRTRALFSVHLLGWDELWRRLNNYPQLIEKHYGYVALGTLRDAIPQETVRLMTESLRQLGVVAVVPSDQASTPGPPLNAQAPGLAEALERDFTRRYTLAMQRSMFPELLTLDLLRNLAKEIVDGNITSLSTHLRRTIFLRAARSTALRNAVEDSAAFLAAGEVLPGAEPALPAQARLAEARGDVDGAIRMLRDAADSDARSVLLAMFARHKGDPVALTWFADQRLAVRNLTPNGVLALSQIHLRQQNFQAVNQTLSSLSDEQCRESPYFLFLRGVVRIAAVLPRPEQAVALTGLPLDLRMAHPILPDQQLATDLDAARSDLERFLAAAPPLELREAPRVAETYLIWCDFLHPRRRATALAQLRSDITDPAKAISRVQFALAYDADNFDRRPIVQYLERRDGLGGLTGDELRAGLLLRLDGNDPAAVAEFISKHRAQFDQGFDKAIIIAIEIQALAMAGDAASAKLLFDNNRTILPADGEARLSAEIARAEGADPVAEYKRLYETTKTADSLRTLLGALVRRNEHLAVGAYAEELYGLTGDPNDIASAAGAYANAGEDDHFMRIVERFPFVKESDPAIALRYAWQLFRRGRLKEAKDAIERLARDASARDLNLEVAIALESGDWESLAQPLAAFLERAAELDATILIQAAQLAQASGHGRLLDLIDAAVNKGSDDPDVLIGAYTLVIEEGLEEREAEAHRWFNRALDLSGVDGPIKRFELKDLLSQQAEWSAQSRKIDEAVVAGEMPLFVAASGLRTTLVDLVLRNLVTNAALADARKRSVVPAFSGRRVAATTGDVKRLALDISALMVLGWLGLLPKVFEAFPQIMLPASTLYELFEGRRRIRRFQKSRLRRAEQIRELIAQHRLKVLRAPLNPHDELAREIGPELAGLIRAAQANNGLVLRPPPIHRLGLQEMRDADMTGYAGVLTDTHTLLRALHDLGAVDAVTEQTAKAYFEVQDPGWPTPPSPDRKQPLYIDSLALIYLHTVGLLEVLVRAFSNVYIGASAEEDAFGLIEHEQHVADILRVIDDTRNAVRKAHESGKLIFGPRWTQADENVQVGNTPTLHLLGDLLQADAVAFDDRALNKEPFVEDRQHERARIITTLDLLEELHARGLISETERRTSRHRLRTGGACLIPADAAEFKIAAARSGQQDSPEFRALRDSILLPRVAQIPRFPAEIPWFLAVNSALKTALVEIWDDEADVTRAAAIADALHSLYPMPEDWVACWGGQPPPGWIVAVSRILTATLALPFELSGKPQAIAAYNDWLERSVLDPLRRAAPETYQALVAYLRNFVLSSGNDDHDRTGP